MFREYDVSKWDLTGFASDLRASFFRFEQLKVDIVAMFPLNRFAKEAKLMTLFAWPCRN